VRKINRRIITINFRPKIKILATANLKMIAKSIHYRQDGCYLWTRLIPEGKRKGCFTLWQILQFW